MSMSNCLFSNQIFSFLSRFSISSWFSLGRLYVSRNLSISSRLSNLLAYNCTSLMIFLYFCGFSCNFLSLLMLITWALFVFSLVNLAIFFYVLFLFSINNSVSLIFSIFLNCHWFFFSFYFDLYYFLPSTNFGLRVFSSSFRCKIRLLIWDFSFSLGSGCLLWTSLSAPLLPYILVHHVSGLTCLWLLLWFLWGTLFIQ